MVCVCLRIGGWSMPKPATHMTQHAGGGSRSRTSNSSSSSILRLSLTQRAHAVHDCCKVVGHGPLLPKVEPQPVGVLLRDRCVGSRIWVVIRLQESRAVRTQVVVRGSHGMCAEVLEGAVWLVILAGVSWVIGRLPPGAVSCVLCFCSSRCGAVLFWLLLLLCVL